MADLIVIHTIPEMGHIVSAFELAKLILRHRPSPPLSLSVSILIAAGIPSDAVLSFISDASAASPSSSIDFHHVPPAAPPPPSPDSSSPFDMVLINNPSLRRSLLSISQGRPGRIKAFVVDFLCTDSARVSGELGIPTYGFFTSSAHGLAALLYTPALHRASTGNLRDLDSPLHIPGYGPVHSSDMPPEMMLRESSSYSFFLRTAVALSKHLGNIVNTFRSLERTQIGALTEGLCVPDGPTPPLFCVGPLVRGSSSGGNNGSRKKAGCLKKWLDSQPEKSVVFLCFGSMGLFSAEQLKAMAMGLEKSGVRFLWVVRCPTAATAAEEEGEIRRSADERDLDSLLPEGFLDRTRERGLVVRDWAPQVEVLSHDSVGGFVTHCGWNSVLEAVCAGVPMVAWPLYAEQRFNRVVLVEEIKVALPMRESAEDGFVCAAEVERRVTELMDSEEGRFVRERVVEMKEEAKAAMSDGGSSRAALSRLVDSWTRG